MARKGGFDPARLIFVVSAVTLIAGLAFFLGVMSALQRNAAFQAVGGLTRDIVLVIEDMKGWDGTPVHFLQPARREGEGVTVNERAGDGKLILLSGYFDDGNELRLIRRDGRVVARWPARFSEHFPDPSHLAEPPATDRHVDTHGALIRPDGSVVFNYEYSGSVKLTRCGEVAWTLGLSTHHSVEAAAGGGYWILGRRAVTDPEAFPPFTEGVGQLEDLILRVSESGEIEETISIPRLLYENGLEPVLTAVGRPFKDDASWDHELVHANKVGELPAALADAFPDFEAGDLLVSLRAYNMILVADPDARRVRWRRTGPWLRQHDPEFAPDGTISVFNNNSYWLTLEPPYGRAPADAERVSDIMKADPATGEVEVVYGGRPGQRFHTVIRGKHELTAKGGLLITEFEGGRVFETDAEGRIVWEYVNRYDEDTVLEISEARLYPAEYFEVEDWSCPAD
ncbi:MAG: arylsulfotransferase family protein [Pseudomonadota bacterium]